MKVWEVPRFSPAYLYQSPLKCVTFSGINTAAMMQQTDHCLLYLSVSFTHLKRSAECSADGPEACPFLSRLTQNFLQNGLRLSRYPSVATRHFAYMQREVLQHSCAQASQVLRLPSKRRVKTVFNHHASSLKA